MRLEDMGQPNNPKRPSPKPNRPKGYKAEHPEETKIDKWKRDAKWAVKKANENATEAVVRGAAKAANKLEDAGKNAKKAIGTGAKNLVGRVKNTAESITKRMKQLSDIYKDEREKSK